jgi:hypothetical protein
MPHGKPAGARCVQLSDDLRCAIFGHATRPACCAGLQASDEMCGDSREHAMRWIALMDAMTRP